MKINFIIILTFFLFNGCASLAEQIHEQGYYNCINNGGLQSECTNTHSYREKSD